MRTTRTSTRKGNTRLWISLCVITATVALVVFALGLPGALAPLGASLSRSARMSAADLPGVSLPASASSQTTALTPAQAREAYGQIALGFEANHGQTDGAVDFLARGTGYTLFLKPTEAVFALRRQSAGTPEDGSERLTDEGTGRAKRQSVQPASSSVLRMQMVGANRAASVAGVDELAGKVNYFLGNDPAKWRTNVPTFGQVRYAEVYPGIDVVYYGNQRQLEYDFRVAPGADWRQVALKFAGADSVKVEAETGDLLIGAGGQIVRQHKPVVYQEVAGERREVAGHYAVQGSQRVGFEIGEYDAQLPLIIDPVLVYSTYLGGSGEDTGGTIAVDASGNAYVAGTTASANFPTTAGAFQTTFGGGTCGTSTAPTPCSDVFVTKLNATGSALIYSTYLGGNNTDLGRGIVVDSSGNAYVTGGTRSANFPTTAGAFQTTFGGGTCGTTTPTPCSDAFVTKLNATGSALIYSTYLDVSKKMVCGPAPGMLKAMVSFSPALALAAIMASRRVQPLPVPSAVHAPSSVSAVVLTM